MNNTHQKEINTIVHITWALTLVVVSLIISVACYCSHRNYVTGEYQLERKTVIGYPYPVLTAKSE